jgi:hypothetical protein
VRGARPPLQNRRQEPPAVASPCPLACAPPGEPSCTTDPRTLASGRSLFCERGGLDVRGVSDAPAHLCGRCQHPSCSPPGSVRGSDRRWLISNTSPASLRCSVVRLLGRNSADILPSCPTKRGLFFSSSTIQIRSPATNKRRALATLQTCGNQREYWRWRDSIPRPSGSRCEITASDDAYLRLLPCRAHARSGEGLQP